MSREFVEGAEALARAAIDAGCRFFAGYPMTPFTEVLDHMAQKLPVASLEWGTHTGVQIEAGDSVNFVADTSPRENVLYLTHCEGYVIDPARAARFEQSAAAAGLQQTANRVVADKKGHLVYCLFQLARD